MATSAGEVEVALTLDAGDFQKALAGSQIAVKNFGDGVSSAMGAQMAKTSGALSSVVGGCKTMESQFSHRFEHVGLQLFMTDLLRSSGLGTEARAIISTLEMGITNAGMAFGASAGPIMLVVAGLTALVGIAAKVAASQKDMTDELLKEADAAQKDIASTDQIIQALERWKEAAGRLTPALEEVLRAQKALRDEQIKGEESTNQQLIATLNTRIAKEKDLADALQGNAAQIQKEMQEPLKYMMQTERGYISVARSADDYAKAQRDLDANAQKLKADEAQLSLVVAKQIDLHKHVTQSLKEQSAQEVELAKQSKATRLARLQNTQAVYDEMNTLRKNDAAASQSMDKNMADWQENQRMMDKAQYMASLKEKKDAHQKFLEDFELTEDHMWKFAKKAGDTFVKGVGDGFAAMIVDGKSFAQSMQELFKNMAKTIISYIIQIILKMLALYALEEVVTFGGASAGAGAAAGAASAASSGMNFMAQGGMIMEPSIITGLKTGRRAMVAEEGPEAIVPMNSQNPSGGSGGSITINISGQFLEGDASSWNKLMRDQIIPQIRRFTMISATGPFNRTRGLV